MSSLARSGNTFRELSVVQHAIVGFASWLLVFSFFQDISQCIFFRYFKLSWLLEPWGIVGYALLLLITFIGTVLPFVSALWLYPQVSEYRKDAEKRGPVYLAIAEQFCGYVGILLLVAAMIAGFYVVERIHPLSAFPFSTTICGILWIGIGSRMLRHIWASNRLTVLAAYLCLILSMEFIDWNSRKPFLRDLDRIRVGMNVAEVESIMAGYIKGHGETPFWDPPLKLEGEGTMIYRHSNKAAYNADWGIVKIRDGKVETVEFSAD